MSNNDLHRVIYILKRQYGSKVYIVQLRGTSVDYDSGDKDRLFSVQVIRKALVLPHSVTRDFVYDLSYIAANKNFTLGGYYDLIDGGVIFDKRDLTIELKVDDYIAIGDQVFKIKVPKTHPTGEIVACDITRVEGTDYESVLAAINNQSNG